MSDDTKEWKTLPWYEVGEAFSSLLEENLVRIKLPLLRDVPNKQETPSWDYPEREWYFWVNTFASEYGWKIEDVGELDIDDAMALMQEIEVRRQLDKEWEHQLSETAYSYDAASKKSKFVPLPRPIWMQKAHQFVTKLRKIPKKFIPPGVVIRVNDEHKDT